MVAAVTNATISSVVTAAALATAAVPTGAASVAAVDSAAAAIALAVAAAVAATVTVAAAAAAATAAAEAVAFAAAVAAAFAAAAAAGGGGMPPQVVGEGKGVVKFFNPQKGFGFVVRDDGGEDVFVHISAVEQAGLTDLADGQPLEFTLVDRGGRISATNLRIDGEPMAVERAERAPEREADGREGDGRRQVLQRDEGLRLHPAR